MILPNFTRWMGSHKDVRLLQMVTLLRSIGQGIALVDLSLLLKELGWSGGAIGALLAAAGIVKTAATLLAGELSALLGAKRFLLLLELITALAALAVSLTTHTIALDIAIVSAGLGSGHSGSGGPAAPIERAWLAAYARYDSSRLFHANALLGYLGMGVGCLLGCLPSWYGSLLTGPNAYRPAFALIALCAAGGAALLLRISGGKRKPKPKPAKAPAAAVAAEQAAASEGEGAAAEQRTAATERTADAAAGRVAAAAEERNRASAEGMKLLLLVLGIAAVFGMSYLLIQLGLREAALYVPVAVFLAILAVTAWRRLRTARSTGSEEQRPEELRHFAYMLGTVTASLSCTMTSYWFSVRFSASTGAIGIVMGLSYIAAGWLSFRTGSGAGKDGALRSVTFMQLISVVLLLAMPWTTSFALAAVLEIGCTACSLGTRGNRTAILMEDKSKGRRSLFSKINYLLIRTGSVLWPGAFGGLIDAGHFASPFLITAALQSIAAWLYVRVHRAPRDAML